MPRVDGTDSLPAAPRRMTAARSAEFVDFTEETIASIVRAAARKAPAAWRGPPPAVRG